MAYNVVNAIRSLAGITPAASTTTQATAGAEGEQLAAEIHGKWYHRARAGQLFIGSTALAGTVVPVNAASLVSTFTLFNPVNSGVNVELARYLVGLAGTTTAVIGNLALAFQFNGTALASLTALTPQAAFIGTGSAAKASLYSAATYTGTPTVLMTLGLSFGTTGAQPGPVTGSVDFDGTIVVPPNCSLTVVGNAAQTQAFTQSLIWAEIPTTA